MDSSSHAAPAARAQQRRPLRSIFLSSTYIDLKEHRAAVRELIEKFGEHPVVMENFGAQDGDPTEVSLDELRRCDVYVLLLGWRYGTIPDGATISVTHQEYRAAKDAGMRRLVIWADRSTEHDDGPDAIFPAKVRDPDHAAQLRAFRDEAGSDRTAETFTTPDRAALAVAVALHNLTRKERRPGAAYPPYKLPPPAPGFVGRANELDKISRWLRAGRGLGVSALVAGMGGVGKSALAAEMLAMLAREPETFPGGFTWVRCDRREGLSGLIWLYDQLLEDWSVPIAPEQLAEMHLTTSEDEVVFRERALSARFRPTMSDTGLLPPAVVLLDNVERDFPLSHALDTLAALNITALVTARHQPTHNRLERLSLDVLEPTTAVQLFAERYRAQGGTWDDACDAEPARKVVEYLGWLPLAIELQATRAALRSESAAGLAANLERDRSQGLLGDPLDATRNLRYSFAQSLKTLTSLQRTRFAALGLPDGPDWPRSVIERLLAGIHKGEEAGASDGDEDDEPSARALAAAGDDLDLLAALSLAILLPDGRVRLHPLLREYAHERWQDEPVDTQRTGLRALLAGILHLIKEHEHDFATVAREEEMIVAALEQARSTAMEPWLAIGIVAALIDYLSHDGHWPLGLRLISWQLEMWRAVGDRRGEGVALTNLSQLSSLLGDNALARTFLESALAIAREVGDRQGEGAILNNLGQMAQLQGQPDLARDYHEQALIILRAVGDRVNEGATLNNLGLLMRSLGQPEQARGYYEQALAIAREVNDKGSEGAVLNNLGRLASDRQLLTEAKGYYEQALALHRDAGNRAMEGTNLNNLGQVAFKLGFLEEARQYYEQALANAREVGYRIVEGGILNNLGQLAIRTKHLEEAERYFDRALVIRREVGDRSGEARTLSNLGGVAYTLGHLEQARVYFERALTIAREIQDIEIISALANNLLVLSRLSVVSGGDLKAPEPDSLSTHLPHKEGNALGDAGSAGGDETATE